ncbi:MAG: hypothetical protein CSA96_02275 [Bacteroidetes bacterium]|nr:MAG: hypothetical protein CSA96_02275 [Bacteroidota bacterium]
MNSRNILIALMALSTLGCQKNNISIEGRIENQSQQTIYLEKLDVNRTLLVDSVKLKPNGSFALRIQAEQAELYILRNSQGKVLNLLLSPGDHISIETDSASFGDRYTVSGSPESENIRKLVEQLNRTRFEMDSLRKAAELIEDAGSPEMDLIRSAYIQTIIRQKRFSIRYIIAHQGELSSVYALYQKYTDGSPVVSGQEGDLQYFKAVADSLEVTHPDSPLTLSLRADITRREQEASQLAHLNELMEMAEVKGLLDLSIPDREGENIALSSLSGKVVLVVFWASGNDNSIRTLLSLKSIYKSYKSRGFEIYAVSLDNNKLDWMSAIDFNEFPWLNVCELSYPDSKASVLYNVTALPSSFLINREGDIMARNLYGKQLQTWLDNLL